jgi:hypothetical protein
MTDSFVIHPDDVVAVTFADQQPYVSVRTDQPTPWGVVIIAGPQGIAGPAGQGEPVTQIINKTLQTGATVFALTAPARATNAIQVFRNGLAEIAGVGFTATTTAITFTTAPLSGDDIVVRYEI